MNSAKLQDTRSIYKKSVIFLYTCNEQSKNEVKKTIPFTIAPKIMKYLGINLIKEMQDLYIEN